MRRAGAEARPYNHRSSGSGVRRRVKSIWASRFTSSSSKFFAKLLKRSFLLDRERPVCLRPKSRRAAAVGLRHAPAGAVFSLAREKKMGGSKKGQPLQMAIYIICYNRFCKGKKQVKKSIPQEIGGIKCAFIKFPMSILQMLPHSAAKKREKCQLFQCNNFAILKP